MFAEAIVLAAIQIGPFFEQRENYTAIRPFYAQEGAVTDILWPLFTAHEDWWSAAIIAHYQDYGERGDQFSIMPFWFNGHDERGETYWGAFPFYGHHPHFLLCYDLDFAMWPLWTSFSMPRPKEARMMRTRCVCWPLVNWRDDGSWGVWPIVGHKYQRESEHWYGLWPIFTWADYEQDRYTSGEGNSWMVWPLVGRVKREREEQWMILPPFFSWAATDKSERWRCPWPLVEISRTPFRQRISIWPFYENSRNLRFGDGQPSATVTRFGWKLIELYDDETRVFPFWVSRPDGAYFRLWPFYEREIGEDGVERTRILAFNLIRHTPQVDRNWAKFWTFYERERCEHAVRHSLFWNLIHWTTKP